MRGLEKLWALSICNIDGFEETMMAMLGVTAESGARREKIRAVWADENCSESLHETWKSSRLFGALEKMLSTSEGGASNSGKRPRNPQDMFLDDPDGNWGFRVNRLENTAVGAEMPRVVGPMEMANGAKRVRMSSAAESRESMQLGNGLPALQLPPQTSQLLDIYFATTHSWLPIVAKHNILRASYLYANSSYSVGTLSPGSGDHAALWAILSYTVSQSRLDPRASAMGAVSLAKEYYSVARSMIPSEKDRYELGHIHALLLLALVNTGLEDWTAAWLLSGQAVRMAIAMGFGKIPDTGRPDDLRYGKAVFLGCFVIDSLISFRLNRCPALSPNDIATIGLLEEDGIEEWNSWPDVLPLADAGQRQNAPRRGPLLALSCFNRLVELAIVLNKISRNQSMGYKSATFSQQLVMDLKLWDNKLPLGCRLIGAESIYPERHSALLPHQTYLGLLYASTLLWLYVHLIPGEQSIHRSQRPATAGAKKLLYRALSMLSQHLENFPMCGFPPIFEFGLRTISEQASALRQSVDASDTFPFPQWTEEFRQKLVALVPTWPLYESLVSSIEQRLQPDNFSQSRQGPFLNDQSPPIPRGHVPPADSIPTPINSHMNPQDESRYASSILGMSIPMDTQSITPKDIAMANTELSMMDGPMGLAETFALHSGADVLYQAGSAPAQTPDSTTSNPIGTGKAPASERSATAADVGFGAAKSEELDAIFKDLAYLDTTEWSTNREAGLKDLGFLDESTFQAFCNDPDRLVGSQPLVHPPSIADIWPPPGFFPETFQDPTDKMDG